MGVLIFDDRDASITYEGEWGQAGVREEFNSTTTFTNVPGASASLSFIGTDITVFGTIAGGARAIAPRSQYVLDNDPPIEFEGSPGRAAQRNEAFYKSPTLSPGQHTLTITNLADGDLFLDLMIVTPVDEVVVSTLTTTATTVATSAATRMVTVTGAAAGASASGGTSAGSAEGGGDQANPSGASARSSGTNAGAIAGGIIGAIVFILLAAFGIVFYRKRKQKNRKAPSESYWTSPSVNPGSINPFPPPPKPPSPIMSQQGYESYPSQYPASQYPSPVADAPSELAYANDRSDEYYGSTYPSSQIRPTAQLHYAPPSSTLPTGNNGRMRINLNG